MKENPTMTNTKNRIQSNGNAQEQDHCRGRARFSNRRGDCVIVMFEITGESLNVLSTEMVAREARRIMTTAARELRALFR
jgi:hypothetical protein